MLTESQIQGQITGFFRSIGVRYLKISGNMAGWPDLLSIKNGTAYFFEVKKENGIISKLQQNTIKDLNTTKEIAFIVRSFEEFKSIWSRLN